MHVGWDPCGGAMSHFFIVAEKKGNSIRWALTCSGQGFDGRRNDRDARLIIQLFQTTDPLVSRPQIKNRKLAHIDTSRQAFP